MKALVVDDECEHRDLMCEVLEGLGWHVEPAEDGIAALGRALRGRPDLVLLDVRMPQMDGLDVLRRLREVPVGAGIRVVLTTGAEPGPELRRLSDAVLVKPFSREELIRAIGAGAPASSG
jgi:CheY-like chemotaxis protein